MFDGLCYHYAGSAPTVKGSQQLHILKRAAPPLLHSLHLTFSSLPCHPPLSDRSPRASLQSCEPSFPCSPNAWTQLDPDVTVMSLPYELYCHCILVERDHHDALAKVVNAIKSKHSMMKREGDTWETASTPYGRGVIVMTSFHCIIIT